MNSNPAAPAAWTMSSGRAFDLLRHAICNLECGDRLRKRAMRDVYLLRVAQIGVAIESPSSQHETTNRRGGLHSTLGWQLGAVPLERDRDVLGKERGHIDRRKL